MMVFKTLLLLLGFVASADLMGQEPTIVDPTISALIEHERRIEQSVVAGDLAALDTVYSADFQFTHGDGQIQTKTEWLATVEQAKASGAFRSRLLRDQVGELPRSPPKSRAGQFRSLDGEPFRKCRADDRSRSPAPQARLLGPGRSYGRKIADRTRDP